MTLAAEPTTRMQFSWSTLRVVLGVLLVLTGLVLLGLAAFKDQGALAGLGVIALGLGVSQFFKQTAEAVMMPALAVLVALVPFGGFLAFAGVNPFRAFWLMYEGAFGSWFSFQNTLSRAAPLMLTGLCTALPMRLGMVHIGGEGALVVGALFAAGGAHLVAGAPPWVVISTMLLTGFVTGGLWVMLAGALKHYRGVNETISSLLLTYIAIAMLNHLVEGPWRDPESLNKPSSWPVGEENMLGVLDFSGYAEGGGLMSWLSFIHMDGVHWGLVIGIVACVFCWVLMNQTVFGFKAQVVGGNIRAAKVAGLSIGTIVLIVCMLAGGAAGLAGAVEVCAVQGAANASVVAGYGYAGILVAFLARHNPLAIIPVAILIGGIGASGGLIQRRLGLPDATVNVLQGFIFLAILASETYYGRLKFFQKKESSVV